MRQTRIDRKGDPIHRDGADGAEVRAVVSRVDTGVRPSAADGFHRVTADQGQRLFERLLYRAVPFLSLSAMLGTAVIGKMQNDVSFFCVHFQSPYFFMTKIATRNTAPSTNAAKSRPLKRSCFIRVLPSPPW